MRNVSPKTSSTSRTKKQLEELSTNKMLLVFGVSALYLFLMSLIRNGVQMVGQSRSTTATVLYAVLLLTSLALIPIGLIVYYRMRRAGKQPQYRLINGINVSVLALVVFCCAAAQYLFGLGDMGMKVTYLSVVAAAALSIIYWIFRRECWLSMLILGISALVDYLLYRLPYALSIWMDAWKLLGALYALALVIGVALLLLLKKNKGALRFGQRKVHLLPASFNYWPVLAAIFFAAAVFALCVLLGSYCFYYAVFAMAIVLVGYGVYSILLMI